MMVDFKQMAGRAKANDEARIVDEKQKSAEENEATSELNRETDDHLRNEVLPILERAKADFAASGVESRITVCPNPYGSGEQHIVFQFVTPRRPSDGRQTEMPAVFFQSKNNPITVGKGTDNFDRTPNISLGSSPPTGLLDLIAKALKEATDHYYREWDRSRSL
jgi:hypothetical protein